MPNALSSITTSFSVSILYSSPLIVTFLFGSGEMNEKYGKWETPLKFYTWYLYERTRVRLG